MSAAARTVGDFAQDLFVLASTLRAARTHLSQFEEQLRLNHPGIEANDVEESHDVGLILARAAESLDDMAFEVAELEMSAPTVAGEPTGAPE